jgi:hypothetical protein
MRTTGDRAPQGSRKMEARASVRNCSISGCSTAVSYAKTVSKCLRIAESSVKFPDSRKIARRPVRSARQPQPGSLGVGETSFPTGRKAHNGRAFAVWWTVSRLQSSRNARPICRKSPACYPEYSRFRKTSAGDRVRSPLHGAAPILFYEAEEGGAHKPSLGLASFGIKDGSSGSIHRPESDSAAGQTSFSVSAIFERPALS